MKNFFPELIEYNQVSNQALFVAFQENQVPQKSMQLLNHMMITHHVWNHRIIGEPSSIEIWGDFSLEELIKMNQQNFIDTETILSKFPEEEVIHYQNSKGVPYEATVKDILFHVMNHFTYHRAQIATNFRENGLEPVVTDYIYYKVR